jgi:hypothetical protein
MNATSLLIIMYVAGTIIYRYTNYQLCGLEIIYFGTDMEVKIY